jgi:iron complex outermembrane recepter protein
MFKKTKVCAGVMLAFGGALITGAPPVFAQQQLDRVEVTGSSIRRIASETALPVTVIKVEELTKQGITNAEQAMTRIVANQSSFGASSSIGGTTGGKSEADLRGLSGPTNTNANKTLVLLNGRRIANHAFDAAAVDLNAIPLAAVDRIEILRDGASAIYGSDAIGGVINFILRREVVGLELSGDIQKPQRDGGGDTKRMTISGGFGSLTDQRFNIFGSIDVRKQSVLEAKDRNFASTGVIRGAVVAGTSGSSFPGDLNGFEPSLAAGCAPPNSIPNPAGTACRYDFTRDIDIITENEQTTGLLRGSFAITPDHTASIEYLRAHNKSTARVAPAPNNYAMPVTSPFFPAGATPTVGGVLDPTVGDGVTRAPGGTVNWRLVPAGKRTSGDDTTTERTMAEVQGILMGWDYRTAIGTSQNKSEANVKRGYVSDDQIALGIWNGVINPFGPQTAAGAAAIEAAQNVAPTQIGKNKVNFGDIRISNPEIFQLPAGPVGLAFGVEHRTEKSSFEALPITAVLGSLGIDPDSDTAGSRKASALYAELSIPVVKDLELSLAARYDKYNDFGDTFNPKIGLRYQPTKELLVRGTYNSGFRAPTLYEIYQPQSLTFTSDNYDDPLLCPGGVAVPGALPGTVCGQQTLQRVGGPGGVGLPPDTLQPEKSKSLTLGLVFEPTSAVTLGVDYWKINIKNLISSVAEQAVFGDATKYAGKFVRCSQLPAGPGAGIDRLDVDVCQNFPNFDPIAFIDSATENLGELRTEGIDVSAAWRSEATSAGRFGLSFEGTYVTKYQYQRERNGEFINAVGRYSDNAPIFRWQHVVTATWSSGPWAATLGQRMKSGYVDQDGINAVKDYYLFDTSIAWTGIKGLTVVAGINNLFDTAPPLTGQVTTFQRGYDPRFTDPLGRTFTLRAAYKFF